MRNDFSAGGVVVDAHGRIALVKRASATSAPTWSLPKGHPKKHETAADAAIRETKEETGLQVQVVPTVAPVSIEYEFEDDDGARVRKRVDFYRMTAIGGDRHSHDDEVIEVALLAPADARRTLTYANERSVLDQLLA